MNIAQSVERAAKFFPDRAAVVFEGATLTYGELNSRANRLANALKANGVQRGDRVALYLPNIPEFPLAYIAVQKVGAVAVSVNSMFKSGELEYILNDSGSVFSRQVISFRLCRGQSVPRSSISSCPEGMPRAMLRLTIGLPRAGARGMPRT